MGDETEVWEGWLRPFDDGSWHATGPVDPDHPKAVPVIAMRRPDHGFLPGDRVRTSAGREGWYRGTCSGGGGGYSIVEYNSDEIYAGFSHDQLTRIDPEPPVERTYTEDEVRKAVESAYRNPNSTRSLMDNTVARLREGVSDGEREHGVP